jgi:hypothetical protein
MIYHKNIEWSENVMKESYKNENIITFGRANGLEYVYANGFMNSTKERRRTKNK